MTAAQDLFEASRKEPHWFDLLKQEEQVLVNEVVDLVRINGVDSIDWSRLYDNLSRVMSVDTNKDAFRKFMVRRVLRKGD